MTTLVDVAQTVRAKNAGPFWLTIDIFLATSADLQRVAYALTDDRVAAALGTTPGALKRFEIAALNVLKFSLPRPQVQGTVADRDMHGAAYANLLAELPV